MIVESETNWEGVPFSSLKEGEVFCRIERGYSNENKYFMRLKNTKELQNTAVNLYDGSLVNFDSNKRVIRVQGYFKIVSITDQRGELPMSEQIFSQEDD